MLKPLKHAALDILRSCGIFSLAMNSRWRQRRLLILCYHGTSIEDEHLWQPRLYVEPQKLEQRLEYLKRNHFSVLPLGEAVQRLRAGTLPPRSVALTFDDGTYDFFRQAYPLLRTYGFPATVYQTTYYIPVERPVFHLICSYMLWKRRGEVIADGKFVGLPGPLDLRTASGRTDVVRALRAASKKDHLSALQKDETAERLAGLLKIDYAALRAKRILQLMNAQELKEISRNGVDVELHTHRHRTPEDETLFRKEIQDNRSAIRALTGTEPVHFCYPSGVYRLAFLPWLRQEQVVSATTCDTGLAQRENDSLLLPRFVDQQNRTQVEFESWATGVGSWLPLSRRPDEEPGKKS